MTDVALQRAADFVSKYEGFMPIVYRCPAGFETFGFGSLLKYHPGAKFPMTKEQAKVYLQKDLESALTCLDRNVDAPININQTIALLSFIYNVGAGNFINSTLRKCLNLLQYPKAADEFLKWNKTNGKVSPGLVRRRQDERELFLTPIEDQNGQTTKKLTA